MSTEAALDALLARGRPYAGEVKPGPLVISWQGRQLRVHHDDPGIDPYTPTGSRIRSAVELASDVDGLRLALASTIGERYRVRVSDDGLTVGLWRKADS